MKLRPLAVGAVLAAVALFGSACGKDDPAPSTPDASNAAEQGDSARDELKAALEKSAQESSLKMSIEMATGTIDAHIDNAAKTARMTMDMKVSGESMKMEMLTIGTETYIQYISGGLAEQMKGKWVKVDAASVGQDEMFGELFDPESLLKDGVTVSKIAEGQYKAELGAGETPDIGGLFSGLTGEDSPDPSASEAAGTVTFTLDADGRVASFKAEGASPEATATITVSDYGMPLTVEKPADKDVIEG